MTLSAIPIILTLRIRIALHYYKILWIDPCYPAIEDRDCERRAKATLNGVVAPRLFHSAVEYKSHLLDNGLVAEEDCGGLYERILLRETA
jgi:hypothetical protein